MIKEKAEENEKERFILLNFFIISNEYWIHIIPLLHLLPCPPIPFQTQDLVIVAQTAHAQVYICRVDI